MSENDIEVIIDLDDFRVALNAAYDRIIGSVSRGIKAGKDYNKGLITRFDDELIGAIGEVAYCKASGKYFIPRINTFHHKADCGSDIEVRATSRPDGSLIVRTNDVAERRFVLAIVSNDRNDCRPPARMTVVSLKGWMRGEDAKKKKWFRNPNSRKPAWFVPQEDLNPMSEVIKVPRKCQTAQT